MANYWANQLQRISNQAQGQGDQIGTGESAWTQEQQDLFGNDQQAMQNAWGAPSAGLTGQYGFSTDTLGRILDPSMQGNVSQYATSQQGLDPDTAARIAGDPSQVQQNTNTNLGYLGQDVDWAGNIIGGGAQNLTDVASKIGGNVSGSFDPSQFDPSSGYTGAVRGALGQEGDTLGAAANRPGLGLSGKFQQDYQFTPEDQQNMVTAAGTTVGNQYRSLMDQATARAAAEGNTSPLAVAAAQADLERQSAAQSADAMTQARLGAKQLGLSTTATGEQMRLGTEQDISSRNLQAGEVLGQAQVGAANTGEQMRLSGVGSRAGLQLGAAEYGGTAQMGAAQGNLSAQEQIAQQQMQEGEFGATQQQNADIYANTQGSQRAVQGEQLRQGQQGAYYNQNVGANQIGAGRYMTAEEAAMQQQQQQRQQTTTQTQMAQQGTQGGYGLQNQTYGAKWNATSGAMNNAAYYGNQPGMWSKLLGAGLGAAGAIFGGPMGAAIGSKIGSSIAGGGRGNGGAPFSDYQHGG